MTNPFDQLARNTIQELLDTGLDAAAAIRDIVNDLTLASDRLPLVQRAQIAASIAGAYDQTARAVRRTLLLARRFDDQSLDRQSLDDPAPEHQASDQRQPRPAQIDRDPAEPGDRDPAERLDPPDPDPARELPDAPLPDLVRAIRNDLAAARPPQVPAPNPAPNPAPYTETSRLTPPPARPGPPCEPPNWSAPRRPSPAQTAPAPTGDRHPRLAAIPIRN